MKRIALTKGYEAFVDDEDFEMLSGFRWQAMVNHGTVYACRTVYLGGGRRNPGRKCVGMHRMILLPDPDQLVDHRDGNGLDNRRFNLRFASHSQNCCNREAKGYAFHRAIGKWQAQIGLHGRSIFLGYFSTEEEAAAAYDSAATDLHGDFAKVSARQVRRP